MNTPVEQLERKIANLEAQVTLLQARNVALVRELETKDKTAQLHIQRIVELQQKLAQYEVG